jgi:predicted nucleic acid-binding protein
MKILLDTNLLCRLAQKAHPFHAVAADAVSMLKDDGHELCLVPQVLYEYWVVVTRPTFDHGLGMQPAEADRAIEYWLELFTLLRDERGIFAVWRELVRQYDVQGKTAHDTRLVAAMKRHGLQHIVTFNVSDFRRYQDIQVLDARSLARP